MPSRMPSILLIISTASSTHLRYFGNLSLISRLKSINYFIWLLPAHNEDTKIKTILYGCKTVIPQDDLFKWLKFHRSCDAQLDSVLLFEKELYMQRQKIIGAISYTRRYEVLLEFHINMTVASDRCWYSVVLLWYIHSYCAAYLVSTNISIIKWIHFSASFIPVLHSVNNLSHS